MDGDRRLFAKVKERVRAAIRAGTHPIGSVLPDAETLARRARCSPGTVRRALTELAHEGIVRRVQAKGTVVAALPPAGRATLLLSDDMHANVLLQQPTYAALVAAGLEVEALPLPSLAPADVARAARAVGRAARGPGATDVVVLVAPHWGDMRAEDAAALRAALADVARVVVIALDDPRPPVPGATVVAIDPQHAARLVLQHLIELGHRRIAVGVGAMEDEPTLHAEAFAACRHLAAMAGAEVVAHRIEAGVDAAVALLRDGRATAYWAITDHYATLLLAACREAGVAVPARASLVGRNDTPWSVAAHPALTTLSLEPRALAAAAADAARAANGDGRLVRVAPRLVVRGSTGPAPRARR